MRSALLHRVAQIVVATIGIWLMVAPHVLGYEGTAAADNHRVVGPIVFALAVVSQSYVTRMLHWLEVPLGAWLAVAPLVLVPPARGAANAIASGVVVLALGLLPTPRGPGLGGGWRAVLRPS